jgi:hypothetical protein
MKAARIEQTNLTENLERVDLNVDVLLLLVFEMYLIEMKYGGYELISSAM